MALVNDIDYPKIHLYQNPKSGVWWLDLVWAVKPRRQRISLRTKDENLARHCEKAFVAERLPAIAAEHRRKRLEFEEDAAPRSTSNPVLTSLVDWYLDVHLANDVKARTLAKYRQVLTDLVMYCKTRNIGRVQQISFRVLKEWMIWYSQFRPGRTRNGHAPKTRHRNLGVVRSLFNAAVRAGELEESPIKYWDLPKIPKTGKRDALRPHELAEVLGLIQEHAPSIANLCKFAAHSGWRISDIMDLRWGEIIWATEEIDRKQIKTSDGLNYPISPILMEILDSEKSRVLDAVRPAQHVFLNESLNPFEYDSARKQLKIALRRCNYPKAVGFHTFRRTFGAIAANNGVPPKVLQNLMGHADLKTTLLYYSECGMSDMRKFKESLETLISETVSPPCHRVIQLKKSQ